MNVIVKYILVAVVLLTLIGVAWRYSLIPSSGTSNPVGESWSIDDETDNEPIKVVASGLRVPWGLAFLPEGGLLVTERPGNLLNIATDGTVTTIASGLGTHTSEGGLLGLALHPDFKNNRWLYLYLTYTQGGELRNRVDRYRLADMELSDRMVIIDGIPGSSNHDGGRIAFGPDGLLYITTGDAGNRAAAQDFDSLAGKILRVTDDGSIPSDNFGTAVYSFGHRNPQGLAWDQAGRLWSTEHGRSGVLSGLDEINLIEQGANYGWPESEGDTVREGTVGPARHSGSRQTWAPASAAYFDGSLYFGGLRGEALYEAVLQDDQVVEVIEHFKGGYGRIRTVVVGPDGFLYMTTSNRDGRGRASEGDDKIIRVDPKFLQP